MKNFDAERKPRRSVEARTFTLGGQEFVARDRFRPEVLLPLESLDDPILDHTTCTCSHRLFEHADSAGKPTPCNSPGCTCEKFVAKVVEKGSPLSEQLVAIDETILGLIEPGGDAAERYKALRADEDDALDVPVLMEIVKWCTAGEADRPTGEPSVSTPGLEPTGTPSTEDSLSLVTAAG